MSTPRRISGRLAYLRRSDRSLRGHEDFVLSRQGNGAMTMRCLARTEDSGFLRDVVYTLGPDRRPHDAFVRLQVRSRWIGSGYFHCGGDELRLTVDNAELGRVEESLAVPPRWHLLTHAVMLDGWTLWAADPQEPDEQEVTVYNTSTRWDGTDGPAGRLETMGLRLLADRRVEVAAGRFPCRAFRLESQAIGSPPCTLCVTGESHLLVRYDWPGLDLLYELESLVSDDG